MDGDTDFSKIRADIEKKLHLEKTNLQLIKDSSNACSQITDTMLTILGSFEQSLAKLEETIVPIYRETENLQRRKENTEKALSALDHVISFYNVSREVEPVIKNGPTIENLDTFLSLMGKLQSALDYFEKHNQQSIELENVLSLHTTGSDALNRAFRDLLTQHSRPVAPILILELVSAETDSTTGSASSTSEDSGSVSQLSEPVRESLIRIAEWLMVHGKDDYLNVFARLRADTLKRSIQGLRTYQKSASSGNEAGPFSGSPAGLPAPSPVSATTKSKVSNLSTRKSAKRLNFIGKTASRMLVRASHTFEQSTGFNLSRRATGLISDGKESSVNETEVENFLLVAHALQKLMQSELFLMVGIVPMAHQRQVFEIVVKESLEILVQDGDALTATIRRCVGHHDFCSALVVFPALRHLLNLRPEYERTLEGCDSSVRSKFTTLLTSFHNTGMKVLEDFIEMIRTDNSSQLPPDGTVHELASNILVFLEQLTDYVDTVGSMLSKKTTFVSQLGNFPLDANRNQAMLGIYIRKVLVQLNFTMITKSDAFSDNYLKAIFRLNNNSHILKALQRSPLLRLVQLSEPDCEETYVGMIEEQKQAYLQSWNRVLSHITATGAVPVAILQAGQLRDRDRATLKERFSAFNKEIEDVSRVQKGYCIPDQELRETLKKENKEIVLLQYTAFYEKYAHVQFSKNSEKYCKYHPTEIAALLDGFFDVSA